MELPQNIFNKFNPRQVKFLTIIGIGLLGIAIALIGYVFSDNQGVQISQVGADLFHSPIGNVVGHVVGNAITSITSLLC